MKTEQIMALAEKAAVLDHNECADWYSEELLTSIPALSYKKNARFIAACSPNAFIALVQELAETQKANAVMFQQLETALQQCDALTEKHGECVQCLGEALQDAANFATECEAMRTSRDIYQVEADKLAWECKTLRDELDNLKSVNRDAFGRDYYS